jgi:predicted amidophosphoribosyltransferase
MRPRHQLGWELPNALRVRSISYYSGPIARYIQIAKSQPFGYLPKFLFHPIHEVLKYWSEELRDLKFDAITHVPGNTLRCFVETDLSFAIAENLALELKKPHVNLLFRPLSLRQQKNLSAEKRWSSRKRDFLAHKKNCRAYKGRKILIVDDVCTSGSSLFFASQSLIQEGIRCEDALVLSCSPSFSRIQCLFEPQSRPMINNHYGRGI